MSAVHARGSRVLVVMPGDPHSGEVGDVERSWVNEDGEREYAVRFCAERDRYPHHLGHYLADEIEPA